MKYAGDKIIGDKIGGDKIAGDKIVIMQQVSNETKVPIQTFEPQMIPIPAGSFLMGRKLQKDVPKFETPLHEVYLPTYHISRFPITQKQFERFVRVNKNFELPKETEWFNRRPRKEMKDHPIFGISWVDSMVYCAWLSDVTGRNYRLPTEAEWEKAACWSTETSNNHLQASLKRLYPWGQKWQDECCNVGSDKTTPVNSYRNGASAYGVQDMLGNVQEWTCSLWGSSTKEPYYEYEYDPDDGREVKQSQEIPPNIRVVVRGGSYRSRIGGVSNTKRNHAVPNSRIAWRGFRVVMETR